MTSVSLTEWIDEKTAERVIAAALSRGGDFAEVYGERTESIRIPMEENKIQGAETRISMGAGIRVIHGEKQGYAYSDDLSLESLLEAARVAAYIAEGGYAAPPQPISRQTAPDYYPIRFAPSEADVRGKVQLVQRANAAAHAQDPRVRQVQVSYADNTREILVANSEGLFITDQQTMLLFRVVVMAVQGKEAQMGFYGGGGRIGMEYFEANPPECLAAEAVRQAIVQLGAAEAPAGTMPVVIDNAWGGVWLHEAVGHGLEADFNRKRTSIYSDRIGEKVASELCTVVDDATLLNKRGSINIDDEGVPGQRKVLIEKGVLRGYMHDRLNARLMGARSTGSGRRQDYQCIPMPRMTNTFLEPGEYTPDEIIGSVTRGFYAKNFSGGQVDISNGNYVFNVTEGYLIEHGKIGRPVRNATLIGNGPNDLTRVVKVGCNWAIDPGIGTCGKDGQAVPVGVGMPMILVSEMTVGGTSL
ncbi:MAG: TldD/PmbA family protein [Chloroherpetonaceae bacterium]|nr:TldD/PmbA family protein [Chthonomonadaceae bacterium]MDW8206299.1 TldD/PmbA family protein [Chloroherpetonaceae bacterium]